MTSAPMPPVDKPHKCDRCGRPHDDLSQMYAKLSEKKDTAYLVQLAIMLPAIVLTFVVPDFASALSLLAGGFVLSVVVGRRRVKSAEQAMKRLGFDDTR